VREHLASVATDTLADALTEGPVPAGWPRVSVALSSGSADVAIRRRDGEAAG
jgi:hypothetical protein